MSELEDRLNSLNARLTARAAELEQRIAERFGSGKTSSSSSGSSPTPSLAGSRLAQPSRDGARYGLYVGVNEYAVPCNPLAGCVADARNLAAVCRELGGWSERNQTVLTDSQATVSAIRAALHSLAGKAKPGDVVLYFQSSHGGPNGIAPASNDTCLWGHDGRYEEADLLSDLCRFRKGVQLVVMVDACYSGGLFAKSGPGDAGAEPSVHGLPERLCDRFRSMGESSSGTLSPDDIGWITAADNGQTSLDQGSSGGYFTTFTVVNNGWRAGMAAGLVDSILSAPDGRAADLTPSVALAAVRANPARPASGVPFVTFLDLAVFAMSVWKGWVTTDGKPHVPQFANPDLLHSVVAGRTGVFS